jgi:F-type H+-transporting ATPase subunit delta
MINRTVARRYAQALFSLGAERDELGRVESDFSTVVEVVQDEPQLKGILENELVPVEKKEALLEETFGEVCSPLTLNFLRLLIEKNRQEYLTDIYVEFRQYADEARGIQEANVTLAEEPSEETRQVLREGLEKLTGKKIRMVTSIDPDIIGGVVVRIGDRLYDASIRHQLEAMEEALVGSQGEKEKGVTEK